MFRIGRRKTLRCARQKVTPTLRHHPNPTIGEDFEADGFVVVPSIVRAETCALLIEMIERVAPDHRRGGIRNALDLIPAASDLATSPTLRSLIRPVLGALAFPVRAIVFDKTTDANWGVLWHQDLTVAVREKIEVPGFGPWSEKAGVPHVQATADVLGKMLAVRIHLDECGLENGPLRVIPGSHRIGILNGSAIEDLRRRFPAKTLPATLGSAILLRPLLVHSSSPATLPAHRRVLHIEYAAAELPGPLRWHARERSTTPQA